MSLRKQRLTLVFIVYALQVFLPLYGQVGEIILLTEALKRIERTFDVRFSYAENDLEGLEVNYQNLETLESELDNFSQQVPFVFNRISSRFYSVVQKDAGFTCAKLFAADTGKPLSGATVTSLGDAFGAVTDNSGVFHLPESVKTDKLEIRYLGYETTVISPDELGRDCPVILVSIQIAQLESVLISEYLVPGLDQKVDGSVSIKTNSFGLLPGQVENDVLQIAQAIPGVQSANESISNINIRGGTNDENLILWNGIKMYQNGHFFGLITAFNPDITREVNVYLNGTPTYLSDGVSGTIDMRSAQEVNTGFSAKAGVNLLNANAYINVPITEKIGLEVAGRRSINDLWETNVYQSFANKAFQDTEVTNSGADSGLDINTNVDFGFYDFSARLLWDPGSKDKIRLNFLSISNQIDLLENVLQNDLTENNDLQQESLAAGISWERQWNNKVRSTFLAYGTLYDLNALNRDIQSQQEVIQENEVLETSASLATTYQISYSWVIETGYQFTETGISNTQDVNLPRFRDFEKDVLRTHSGFAGLRFSTPDNQTRINAGVRANYFDKFSRVRIEPRFSLLQQLWEGFSIEMLGEMKNQATWQRVDLNSDFLGLEKRRWILANDDDLPVKESRQGSIGLIYQQSNWLVSAKGFLKIVDGIASTNQGFQDQYEFVQTVGSYTATGGEFTINKKGRRYSVWLTYAYLDNQYDFPDLTPSIFPHNFDINHSLNFAGTYYVGAFKVAAGVNWRTGKPYTQPVEGTEIGGLTFSREINYEESNSSRLDDYIRADISGEYSFAISDSAKGILNVSLLNITNRNNLLNRRYALLPDQDGQIDLNRIDSFSLGITPNAAIRIAF